MEPNQNGEQPKTELVTTGYFNPQVWAQMKDMSQVFFPSKAIPSYITNAPQLTMILQAGHEMGMKPVEAMKSLYIVNGNINLWGSSIIRRLREHGWRIQYEMKVEKGGTCIATVTKGDEKYVETMSFESAELSGYTKSSTGALKVGWKPGVNRNLKLRYGVISMIVKTYIPEVLGSASDIVEVAEDRPVEEGEIVAEPTQDGKSVIIKGADKTAIGDFIAKAKAKKEEEKKPQASGKDINVPTKEVEPEPKEELDNAQKDGNVKENTKVNNAK